MAEPLPSQALSDIAIVGVACRFGGDADSENNFWDMICKGRSAYSENYDRWNPDGFHHPSKKLNTALPRGAHFIKQDLAEFDANYFNISKAEAEAMDPQQRWVLETTIEALEQAGLTVQELSGSQTGVWMGNFTSDYREMLYYDPETAPMYTLSGASNTSTSNRISYFMNFHGPSFTLNTACSSSLVATHLACQSLSMGEATTAVVSGTSLVLNPDLMMFLSNQNFLAADGKCKTFDESGDGYGRGDGAATIILKRVEDAIAHGDPIRAVIRGSSINQDGRTKGMTLPNADAQVQLIQQAYINAGVEMNETRFWEAHGTGTAAGDKTETEAISRVMSQYRSNEEPLLLGGVKSNIGHLEAAAGLASIIKCVKILETGWIPPTPSCKNPNKNIKWDEWHLSVPVEMTRWPTDGLRRLSTQGFGYGGTNAHVVMDDALHYLKSKELKGIHYSVDFEEKEASKSDSEKPKTPRIFYLTAHDKDGLKRVRDVLAEHLSTKEELSAGEEDEFLRDLAFTLNERRSKLQWRTFAIASSVSELKQALEEETWAYPEMRAPQKTPRMGFVFTGQGAQWAEMGMKLMQYPVFKESVERSAQVIKDTLGCDWDGIEEISRPKDSSKLGGALYSQTLCTVLQVGLVDLLASWNIHPCAVAGHSSGEIGAAYCLGVLNQEDAVRIAYFRGHLSTEMKTLDPSMKGAMMAIGASPEEAEAHFESLTKGVVVVACVNSPSSVTVSGDLEAIEELETRCKDQGVFARKLKVDTAYHSPHMQTVAAEYFDAIADIATNPARPGCKMHSSVIGREIQQEELGAGNWVRNLVSAVQFADAVHDMVRPLQEDGSRAEENAVDVLVEVGPHGALEGPATQTLGFYEISGVDYYSVLKRQEDDIQMALTCVAKLMCADVAVDSQSVNGDENAKPLINLPSYPWNHSSKFWSESRLYREHRYRRHPRLPLLGAPTPTMGVADNSWRGNIRMNEEPWVREHVIQDATVYPAAGYLAMAIEAALQRVMDTEGNTKSVYGVRLRDVKIEAALMVEEDFAPEVIITLRPHQQGTLDTAAAWTEFTITSSTDGQQLTQNCFGLLMIERETDEGTSIDKERKAECEILQKEFEEQQFRCTEKIDVSDFYTKLAALGLQYGPSFAKLTEAHHNPATATCFGTVDIPEVESAIPPGSDGQHVIHPTVLDCVFHLTFAAMVGQPQGLKSAMVPTTIEEVFISTKMPSEPQKQLTGWAQSTQHGMRELSATIDMFDPQTSTSWVHITGFQLSDVSGGVDGGDEPTIKPITFKPEWKPAVDLLTAEEVETWLHASAFSSESEEKESTDQTEAAAKEEIDASDLADKGVDFGKLLLDTAGWQAIKNQLNEYLNIWNHNKADISLLEIGSSLGTSGPVSLLARLPGAAKILDAMSATFSVPEASMKDAASSQFGSSSHRVTVADWEEDLKEQKFDIVVAFAPEVDADSVKDLLNEGGRACILEIQNPQTGLASLLKSVECERKFESVAWKDNLEQAEFATKFTASGLGSSPQLSFTIAALESESAQGELPAEFTIVEAANAGEAATKVADQLESALSKAEISVSRVQWSSDLSSLEGKNTIILTDLEKAILPTLSEQDFEALKQLVLGAEMILWVSGNVGPEAAMVSGLARTVNNEMPACEWTTLEIDAGFEAMPDIIERVLRRQGEDSEFCTIDGKICVSRYLEDVPRNEDLATRLGNMDPKMQQVAFKDMPSAVKLMIQSPGMLDSLCFEQDPVPDSPLPQGYVEIDVKASGINFRDVMVSMGQIPDKLLGFEGAGYVRRVADDVTIVKEGQRVCFLAHGAHRTVHRVRAEYAVPITDEITFEDAGGILLAHATAWYALINTARAEEGETVLIHAAAGGVGQAAVMLANHLGLEIFATVGSDDKRELIQSRYGIKDDHIFNSRNYSFVQGIKRMTKGKGVDIVLNSLSGEALRQTWTCIGDFGRFVEIGMKDILTNTRLDMRPFMKDASFSFINLNHLADDRPKIMSEVLHGTMDLVKQGITQSTYPVTSYAASDIEASFRLMQAGKHRGKLVLMYDDEDVVPFKPSIQPAQLSGDGCYLLIGGLGGLGRSLSKLFARLGAKRLCFLSRSGAANDAGKQCLSELEEMGVETLLSKCDVSDPESTASAVKDCTDKLGRINGVVQGAMVLQDGLFEKMTYEMWCKSTYPKVQGSWNLHENLPDVDFFLTLSSFAGVFGNRGQSNYAAAGAYEDALATYRRSQGMKAVTLDLGIMRDVGVLAEQGVTDNLKEWEEPCGITEREFHALLSSTLAIELSKVPQPSQIVTGFATARTVQEFGISDPWYFADPRFSILARSGVDKSGSGGAAGGASASQLLSNASTTAEANKIVTDILVGRVVEILQVSADEIDTARPLHTFGIDSLVAVELANWIYKELKAKVGLLDLMANSPITALAEKLVGKSSLCSELS